MSKGCKYKRGCHPREIIGYINLFIYFLQYMNKNSNNKTIVNMTSLATMPSDVVREMLGFCNAKTMAHIASIDHHTTALVDLTAKAVVTKRLRNQGRQGWTSALRFEERVKAQRKVWDEDLGGMTSLLCGAVYEINRQVSNGRACGSLICAMKSVSVKVTLAAIGQFVEECIELENNEGDEGVRAVCKIWAALGTNNGLGEHLSICMWGLIYVARTGNGVCKEYATSALCIVSATEDNRIAIAQKGGIPILLALVQNDSTLVQNDALLTLMHMSVNTENRVTIALEGGIPVLLHIVENGSVKCKGWAMGALQNMSLNATNQISIASGIPLMVSMIHGDGAICQDMALGALRNLAKNQDNGISIASGIPALLSVIQTGTDWCKMLAVGVIYNLALNDDNKVLIAQHGGIPILFDMVHSGKSNDKAIKALHNLALNADNLATIAQMGGIPISS